MMSVRALNDRRAVPLTPHPENPRERPARLDRIQNPSVASRLQDRHVKPVVRFEKAFEPRVVERRQFFRPRGRSHGAHLSDQFFQSSKSGRIDAHRRRSCCIPFQRLAHLVQLDEIAAFDPPDDRSEAGHLNQEPLLRQLTNRHADRCPAHVQFAGQRRFGHDRSRRQPAVENLPLHASIRLFDALSRRRGGAAHATCPVVEFHRIPGA